MKTIRNIVKAMAAILAFAMVAFLALQVKADTVAQVGVTNTVLMVDQNGNLNVSGVASVKDIATNAVNVQIAQTAANAARNTARQVTNELNGIVANIMSNNVVIYRSGYTDAFEGLVVYTTNDNLIICKYVNNGITGGNLQAHIEYVCTADIGTVKPIAMAHDTLDGGRENFVQVASSGVTPPIKHSESRTVGGHTYTEWYEIDVTIPVVGTPSQYFYFIKIEADTPSGDGATLTLVNGVTGGQSTTVVWGDKRLTFKGGVLTGVQDAN